MIYEYLINGYYADEIKGFKDIKCTKGYVSQVIKELLDGGYIELVDKYPKRYGKTKLLYGRMFSNLTSGSLKSSNFSQPRIHLNIISYDILEPCRVDVTEDEELEVKTWTINNTCFVQVSKLFDFGRVVFRIINNNRLLLFTPSFFIDVESFRQYERLLLIKAESLVNWFMRRYGCRVGEPCITRPSEIAMGESDPYLDEMGQKYGLIKLVDYKGDVISWWDSSKGYYEFETRKEDLAEVKAFMPLVVNNMQDRVFNLQQQVLAQELVIEGLLSKIDAVERLLGEIKDIVLKRPENNEKLKEDSYIDVV